MQEGPKLNVGGSGPGKKGNNQGIDTDWINGWRNGGAKKRLNNQIST